MSPRTLAVTFTFLMLASSLPAAEATHTNPLLPDLPTLPTVKPTQECIDTDISPDVLVRANQLIAGDPAWYQNDVGVPVLCLQGQPVPEFVALVKDLDEELNRLRNLTQEIQHQVDTRLEATLPEGALPEDLVEPKVVLLDETFDGTRNTGFGDWQVVTERGEDPVWYLETVQDINGSRTSYRFGDDEGYEQGTHQWLVSPEIDLTAVKANKTAINALVQARDRARAQAAAMCYSGIPPTVPPLAVCRRPEDGGADINPPRRIGEGGPEVPFVVDPPALSIIMEAYEMAFDATIMEAPVMQHAAFLDLTYRVNMAQFVDGVRMWVYSGDRAPDRATLFNPDFGKASVGDSCARDPVIGFVPTEGGARQNVNSTGDNTKNPTFFSPFVCAQTLEGGEVVGRGTRPGLPGMGPAKAFQRNAPDRVNATAFTGEQQTITARLNLTNWSEERIWILFEVKTERNDRGEDTFSDPGYFKNATDYGFEIQRVFVQGDGYHRNLRLKDVGATFPYVVQGNEFGDDPRTVRTTVPPGNHSIVAYVHNAGDYTENATFVMRAQIAQSNAQVGVYTQRLTLAPDEVRTLRIPWSAALGGSPMIENVLYKLNTTLVLPGMNVTVDGAIDGLPDELPPAADPNNTAVRVPNAAGTIPGAGTTAIAQLVRSDTARNLTPIRLDNAFGVPLQLCSEVEGTACDEAYAAPKGEQRIALIGVRNDGNTAQDIVADLHIELDGVAKPDIIAEGVRQTLRDVQPGETRAVMWTLTPTEPGAYRAAVALFRSDGQPEPLVERRFYAQRSTGLLCLDALDVRECGPTFSGGLVPELANEDITALTLAADGSIHAFTEITEVNPDTGDHRGRLAKRDASGAWTTLARLSGTTLNDTMGGGPSTLQGWGDVRSMTFAPDGTLWAAGDNATLFSRKATGELTPVRVPESALLDYYANYTNETNATIVVHIQRYPDLTSVAWHNGTIYVGGERGAFYQVASEEAGPVLLPVSVPAPAAIASEVQPRYGGTIRALHPLANGDLLVLGNESLLTRRTSAGAWNETKLDGNHTSRALIVQGRGRDITAVASYDGRLVVLGEDVLAISEGTGFANFRNLTQPAPLQDIVRGQRAVGLTQYVGAAAGHLGGLWVLDYEGRPALCTDCTNAYARWQQPEIPLSPLFDHGLPRPARPSFVVSTASETILLGEGGLELTLADVGVYDNGEGWTTVPDLAPRDGGVLETANSAGNSAAVDPSGRQALHALPDAAGQQAANAATKFRLFLNHSVAAATLAAPVEVRLVYVNFPSHRLVGSQADTHQCTPMTQQGSTASTVCNSEAVRHLVEAYTVPTQTSGWQARLWTDLPSAQAAAGAADTVAAFYAVEFDAPGGTRWAIDDLHLQGYVGDQWVSVAKWLGPDHTRNQGSVWASDTPRTVGGALLTLGQDPSTSRLIADGSEGGVVPVNVIPQARQWRVSFDTPFALDTISPWHITTQYADRPVFAANNEMFMPGATADCCASPTAPRLFSNWNSRLVSPVIDLSDAIDPVVTFDHLYAFRAQHPTASSVVTADVGYLEVQYLKQGPDCGSSNYAVSCGWSRFFVVRPDADYPAAPLVPGTQDKVTLTSASGVREAVGRVKYGEGYLDRIAYPDETGFISAPRRTEEYVTERVTLSNVSCRQTELDTLAVNPSASLACVPVNLTGRQVRFAFHIVTSELSPDVTFNQTELSGTNAKNNPSYPGEGWYISDFKVLGARQLGIDLTASNMSLRVGYDVASIGVGPGTRVPVNITVANNGTFDALGYTGELRVERVLNAALKETRPVDTVLLGQQPVLPAGESRNHTMFWTVPTEEGVEYLLTIEIVPIGIDRDEDFLDNVATLGTLAKPILAQTVQRFNTEFFVSPENATIDITRYLPMFLNNTGNVPLDGFTVERRISVIGRVVDDEADTCAQWRDYLAQGRATTIVDCREWMTNAPAPAGALTPLTAISSDVSPSSDLFWKAPERANYLVAVAAETGALRSATDRRISAFATYLFDDVEGGPRGEADSGAWILPTSWAPAQPGFRSTDAYAFGDPLIGRYPADANDSIVSPTIDLGNARAATAGFFHRYRFEPGFDAGIVEARSLDSTTGEWGEWAMLPVSADTLTRAGYNATAGYHVQPSSPVHPDGDPTNDDVRAFTGDSTLHPANVDGWVFSEVDLTKFGDISEAGLAYEAYTSIELSTYNPQNSSELTHRHWYDKTWCAGPADEARCWEIENLTQDRVSPLSASDPQNTFWWSGSPSMWDDGVRPIQNHIMTFKLPVSTIAPDQVVIADWWEFASRYHEKGTYVDSARAGSNLPAELFTVYMYSNNDAGAETSRYNLGQPEVVESVGKWYHMRADMTDVVKRARDLGREEIEVGFSYTPVETYAVEVADHLDGSDGWDGEADLVVVDNARPKFEGGVGADYGKSNIHGERPGFAIDGFLITAQRVVRGQPDGEPRTLLDETAWDARLVEECGNGDGRPASNPANLWRLPTDTAVACTNTTDLVKHTFIRRTPLITDVEGRNWAVVTKMPGDPAGWGVVDVRDQDGETFLPTGNAARAWYTGELPREPQTADFPADNHGLCRRGEAETGVTYGPPDIAPCALPGTESRLITPAFDLGRVAGNNAQLAFWHRYAFHEPNRGESVPLSSGGVVEYQEFDAQSGEWSEWRQLFAGDPATEYSGYPSVTARVAQSTSGVYRFDPPFEPRTVAWSPQPLQFLFSGRSSDYSLHEGGWVQESFPIDGLIGKRVRFGFHVAWSDQAMSEQVATRLTDPDGDGIDRLGWWISDVSVVGNVIVGEPVQLRWRAGTDGNVQDGTWQLDDIAVYGSRYRENVGLFVDLTPGRFGAYNGTSATIPITVRNLGSGVRSDLAVEIINTEPTVNINLTAPGERVSYDEGKFAVLGITLGPGQSRVVNVVVGTPRVGGDPTKLLMTLKAGAPGGDGLARIVDNEVQGLLTRTVGFEVQRDPRAFLEDKPIVSTSTTEPGTPVEVRFTYRNTGHGPTVLELTCSAATVTGWERTNHDVAQGDEPETSGKYPCELVDGQPVVPARGTATLTYRVVPTAAGYLRVSVNGTVRGGSVIPHASAGVAIGVPPLAYERHFGSSRETIENFTLVNAQWEYLRGNFAPGSLLIGANENATRNGASYECFSVVCRATTDPIDLHNHSEENPVFLSFWHMDRLAKWDGARVVARRLENEARPTAESSWSPPCILSPPRGGYDGYVRQIAPVTGPNGRPGDQNAAWATLSPMQYNPNEIQSPREFFTSPNGVWEEDWTLAVFDLAEPCVDARLENNVRDPSRTIDLLGGTIRLEFEVLGGQSPNLALMRGPGQGMYIDDITIGPLSVDVKPDVPQRANLLDNTTKGFNVLVENRGTAPDVVRLTYDARNSSAPEGSVSVPSEPITLAPGEVRAVTAYVTLPRDPSLLPTDFKVRLVARSIYDANAAGETTIDLAFGPRQWAELGLFAEAPRGLVQEGTETFVPITVENNGLVASVDSVVRVTDTWAGGTSVVEVPLASIPAYAVAPEESSRFVEFRWRPERGSIGEHTLTIEVDPDALGEEYTRENNVVTFTVPVVELLIPDLDVDQFPSLTLRNAAGGLVTPGLDADVARYEVTAGELVSFELKVANDGRAGATNVDVRAFIGALSLPPKTIPYIAPGTEAIVTFNWLAQKGEHEIEFLVRSEQVELSNANNRYPGVGVTLLTVKGYEVEVAIPDLLGRAFEPGETVDVPFSIRNSGNAGEDLLLVARAPDGTRLSLPREGFYLRAGETYTDKARLILDAEAVAGEQFISIDAVARENPMKVANGRAAMRVNASYGGSVVGANATGAPPTLSIPIELVNEGNSLEPWSVFVRLPAGWESVETMPVKVSVPAHGRITYDLAVALPASTPPGERVLQVKATMPNGEAREALTTINVLPLRAAALEVSEAIPRPDRGALTVPVIVENKGNVQQPFEIILVDPPAGLEMKLTPSTFELPPGGKAVAALSVKPNASVEAGTYAITSFARFEGVTPQTMEGRANLQSIKVPVVRQDLRLSPLEYSPRAGLDAGDRVSVKVSLTNRGLAELTNVPVHLFVDDVFIEEVTVERIASGQRADVTFNWTAVIGVHTLTAVVDPYADTVDGDRADNAVSALATVGEESVNGGVAAGRADTPAPGLFGIFAALAAALLLTRAIGSRRQRR